MAKLKTRFIKKILINYKLRLKKMRKHKSKILLLLIEFEKIYSLTKNLLVVELTKKKLIEP